jgi:hypothetical protein
MLHYSTIFIEEDKLSLTSRSTESSYLLGTWEVCTRQELSRNPSKIKLVQLHEKQNNLDHGTTLAMQKKKKKPLRAYLTNSGTEPWRRRTQSKPKLEPLQRALLNAAAENV